MREQQLTTLISLGVLIAVLALAPITINAVIASLTRG